MRYLILAQSPVTADALGVWLALIGDKPLCNDDPGRMVIAPRLRAQGGGIEAYHSAVRWIESALTSSPGGPHDDFVALVDTVNVGNLSCVSEGMGWDHLIALLIATFPEVKWVFGVVTGEAKQRPLFSEHWLPSLLSRARRDPLLDPTGLRDWVRCRSNEALKSRLDTETQRSSGFPSRLPTRKLLAAAIDDEVDYAFMNAYAAYRYGYRADIITSWALMEERFGAAPKPVNNDAKHGYTLLIEDMRLTFADKPGRVHLSRLTSKDGEPARDHHCPLLAWNRDSSVWRILITTGQSGVDDDLVEDNAANLREKSTATGPVFYKPLGGLCDVWSVTGLRAAHADETNTRGNADGFVWPANQNFDEPSDGHGAPGKLGLVARTLIQRADKLCKSAATASDWIRAAVLASDAAELLSGKTPTMTLTALAIKHECEVRAECTFVGAGYHFGLSQRFDEIQAEVKSVCLWFKRKRTQAERDAEATIINRMRLAFLAAGQFEEEQQCLVKLRWLNRMMAWPIRSAWQLLSPVHWIRLVAWLVLLYGEFLLVRFSRLLTMTVTNALFLVFLGRELNKEEVEPLDHPGVTIANAFLTANVDPTLLSLSVVGAVSGIFHVAILMSYMFSLISRK